MIEQWCSCFPDHLFPEVNNSPATSVDALTASPPQSGDTYFVRRVVGSGATGTALIGRRERDNLAIIAKVVDLGEMDPGQRERTESEIECLSRCRHSAIIQYLTHHLVGTKLLLVMELADAGDLGFQIKHRRETRAHFLEQEVALMLAQILIAVDYIHSQGILHRDIKPANVFVKTNGLVKIGDFGLSKIFEETVSKNVASSLVGTPYYLAPEVWHREKYGKKADMFSIGVLWYEMLTLERPFKGSSVTAVMEAITSGIFTPLPSHLGSDSVALVSALLSRNPEERPSIVEVFERPLMDHAFRIFSSVIVQGLPVSAAAKESVQRDALVLRRKIQQHVDAKHPPLKEASTVQTAMITPIVHLEDGKKWKHRALKLSTNGFLLVGRSVEALTTNALDESGADYLSGSTSANPSDMGKSTSANRAIPLADIFAVNEVPRCFSEGRPSVFAVILRSTDEALWFYSAVDASLTATWMKALSDAIGRPCPIVAPVSVNTGA